MGCLSAAHVSGWLWRALAAVRSRMEVGGRLALAARAVPGGEAHRTKMGGVHAERAPEAPMDPTDPWGTLGARVVEAKGARGARVARSLSVRSLPP